jgi:hypothetical protein
VKTRASPAYTAPSCRTFHVESWMTTHDDCYCSSIIWVVASLSTRTVSGSKHTPCTLSSISQFVQQHHPFQKPLFLVCETPSDFLFFYISGETIYTVLDLNFRPRISKCGGKEFDVTSLQNACPASWLYHSDRLQISQCISAYRPWTFLKLYHGATAQFGEQFSTVLCVSAADSWECLRPSNSRGERQNEAQTATTGPLSGLKPQ